MIRHLDGRDCDVMLSGPGFRSACTAVGRDRGYPTIALSQTQDDGGVAHHQDHKRQKYDSADDYSIHEVRIVGQCKRHNKGLQCTCGRRGH